MAQASGLSCIFPVPDLERTAAYYESLGFRAVKYLNSEEKHVCLYLGDAEIVLTDSAGRAVTPNRTLYGYGFDAYLYAYNPAALYADFSEKGVKFARPLGMTDYGNLEFVLEDADGRWVAFGVKQAEAPFLTLEPLPGAFTVCKPKEAVWMDRPFHFLARTDNELSLVCPTPDAPSDCEAREDGWRGLRVAGQMEFSLVGILSRLSSALAAAGVSLFAVSTYDTDYLFVKDAAYEKALNALRGAGCGIGETI
jgi:uncharacterized glyoxalase superfamily protein PhnB